MKGKRKRGGHEAPKVNPARCPQGMSLCDWQRALRRQAAGKELFGILRPGCEGDPYVVSSGKSGRKYRVEYYGAASALNRCECMDFKTSRLGTCKHIEAITAANAERMRYRPCPLPEHTSVYVDYVDGRKVKVRRGTLLPPDMEPLIATLFDDTDTLRDMNIDPTDFIRRARSLDEGFQWESDAMNLVIATRDKERRKRLVAEKYARATFDGLLHTGLHPYQADGVRFAFAEGRTINADEMGLGKTVQAIATAELLRREHLVESVLIICPTSLKYQWQAEIRRFTDSTVTVVEGNITRRREQFADTGAFYKICSFQAVSNTIKAGFLPAADMIIYDELQRLKNRDTQTGRQLRKLQSQYVMALSGTPLENKLDELYSVVQFVDQYALGPYYRFVNETTVTDDTGRITGYKNLHAVSERLSHTLIRRRKADVRIQMPSRTDTNLFVPMTKEQRAVHDDYKYQVSILINKWRRFKFLSEADRKRLLLYLSMMRMVCDSTFILDQKSRHDTKIDEIMAMITNMLAEGDGKVVIFSQWERMLRILAAELERGDTDFCYLNGSVPSRKRKDLIDRFRDDPECRIFLSTDAGATGLNLQTASLLINIDLPWNPAVLEQRIARIYRMGQSNPVQIINLISRDTIEERMLTTLTFKSNLSAGILDGGDDAVFLTDKKFAKIVEVMDSVVSEEEERKEEERKEEERKEEERKEKRKESAGPEEKESVRPDRGAEPSLFDSVPAEPEPIKPAEPKAAGPAAPSPAAPSPAEKPAATSSAEQMRDTVAGSIAALGKIADVLRSPGGAQAIADALVREDPATGQATLSIPVPDKSTVVDILTAFTALLRR